MHASPDKELDFSEISFENCRSSTIFGGNEFFDITASHGTIFTTRPYKNSPRSCTGGYPPTVWMAEIYFLVTLLLLSSPDISALSEITLFPGDFCFRRGITRCRIVSRRFLSSTWYYLRTVSCWFRPGVCVDIVGERWWSVRIGETQKVDSFRSRSIKFILHPWSSYSPNKQTNKQTPKHNNSPSRPHGREPILNPHRDQSIV